MTDIWNYLKNTEKPIVMYGMGNGADKILSVCDTYGITVQNFFASDGFVRGHFFHGKKVLTYSEIKEKYAKEGKCDFIVLMSFASSRPEVLENVRKISSECEFYLPDVPVSGDKIFTQEFYTEHKDEIKKAYDIFCDDESKRIYENIIRYKLSGDIENLWKCSSNPDEVMRDILSADSFEYTADFGAYNGDSIRELAIYTPKLKKVFALEPDKHSYKKLCEYAENEKRFEIEAIPAGVWSENTTLTFDNSGNRNAHIENTAASKKSTDTEVIKPDTLFEGLERLDYIKYDVEGSEKEALFGTAETINRLAPSLLVSVYHRSEDIFALPLMLASMFDGYKFYLRKFRGIPAWDVNLYAVKR